MEKMNIRCPFCGEWIIKGVIKCPFCGSILAFSQRSSACHHGYQQLKSKKQIPPIVWVLGLIALVLVIILVNLQQNKQQNAKKYRQLIKQQQQEVFVRQQKAEEQRKAEAKRFQKERQQQLAEQQRMQQEAEQQRQLAEQRQLEQQETEHERQRQLAQHQREQEVQRQKELEKAATSGTFTDSRDGKTYKWVKIGNQIWMAENLAFKPSVGSYWAYNNDQGNVSTYGYLYNWLTARQVCPPGWHLPNDSEWTQLTDFAGSNADTKLKAGSRWQNNGNGTDEYGFSALPGGTYNNGRFLHIGSYGGWWSNLEANSSNAKNRELYYNLPHMSSGNYDKKLGFSVRCVRDN
jgi:uncharacterized protein (TIGR02145 family)